MNQRLLYEYNDLSRNPNINCGSYVFLLNQNNIYEWIISIMGPKDTSYSGGLFLLKAIFQKNYPQKAPEIYFITPIYNNNVNPIIPKKYTPYKENLGHILLSWRPEFTMKLLISNVFSYFYLNYLDSPYALGRTKEYIENRDLFEKKIKYFTKKYATDISLIDNKCHDYNIAQQNKRILEKNIKSIIQKYDTKKDWDFSFGKENGSPLNNELIKSIEEDYKYKYNILKEEYNRIKNENNELKEEINKLKMKSNYLNNNNNIINDNKDEIIIKLLKKLEIKENEIKQIKQEMPYELKNGEKLMPIIFISVDQKIHYAFICKNTDKFNSIENLLYEVYPEYQESENYFTVNGKRIIKSKTMEQNNIQPSSIIMLNCFGE